MKPEHLNFVAQKDHDLKELETLLQKTTIEWINYVDPVESSAEASNEKDNVKAVETSDQQTLELENQPDPKASFTAHDKLDRSLKLLKHSNESSLLNRQTESSHCSAKLVALGESQRRSIVDFSRMRTFRASETSQKLGSKVGSDTSKLSERRRLQMEAKLMEQKSQMEIEEKRRELAVKRKQQEMELEELQTQLEIANPESQKTLRQQQRQLKIEEPEGSIKASSISGKLMSLALTDKNSDIKSLLDQGEKESDEVPLQPKRSQDQKDSSRDETLSLLNSKSNLERKSTDQPDRSRLMQKELAIKPISLTQRLVSPNKAHSTNDFAENTDVKPNTKVLSPPGFGVFKPKNRYEFAKPAIKTEPYFQPQFSAIPLTQMSTQVMNMSIPKLKISEFHGDPLEWPEWSSLFTETIHNAPIDDNAKMGHLKTLVKGKAKAAIAGLGYSGSMYTAAWNALVTNFGRPQTIVNAQMKLIHTSPFIKSHDSAAIIKYAQLITTCVNVLKQFGFDGDLYSESVLNSALRKMPPELKTKRFFLAKSKNYYSADLCKFSEWLNEVAYVHDEMMIQFKSPSEKKTSGSGDKVKNTTFTTNNQTKNTTMSTNEQTKLNTTRLKQCPLKDGDHKIWMCNKFKQQSANETYETLKKLKLCFCCLNSHMIKNCTSERLCGVNGCTKKHNRMLHVDFKKSEKENKSEEPKSQNRADSSPMLSTGHSGFLQLIPISIGSDKRCVETSALCDTGSTMSFMDQNLLSLLRLKGKESVMSVEGIHGLSDMKTEIITANVGPSETETIGDTLTFCSHPNLNMGDKKNAFKTLKQEYDYLSNLPDIEISMKDVKVILGQDAYHLIRPLEYKSGEKSQPWAVKTALGWTVSGALPKKETSHLSVSCNLSLAADPLSEQMQKWWDMETYSSVCNVTGKLKEGKRALSILEKTTKHNGERYEVGLLWAEDEPTLPNNYPSAYQQFLSMEKRLANDVELKTAYKATIEKDLESNFVRRLDDKEASVIENAMQWYLPHHPVKHPHKPGKVRRVCNAASKFKGVSLNDKPLNGPDLLQNLIGIVFRFREHEIAMTADIESMFLQVAVPKEECKSLRFLWRDEPSDTVGIYEYTRHVFGAKKSPFCANYGFQQSGRDNKVEFPEASFTID